jgi:hypothetical protein
VRDASGEKNWCWGFGAVTGGWGGHDTDSDRYNELGYNAARTDLSPFALREMYYDCGGEVNELTIKSSCQEQVAKYLPKQSFTMTMGEKSDFRYGIHWNLGDKVNAFYRNLTYTARIKSVYVKIDSQGERINTTLELAQAVDIK